MRKVVLLSVTLAIAVMALAFFSAGSGAEEARNINVSLGSTAIKTGDTLTITYTMLQNYPAGQLYVRDRNTNGQLYCQDIPGSAGTRSVAWPCGAPEGSYYVVVFGVVNDSYCDADACGFTVDNSPPATAASAPGGSGWRRNTVTLTARDTLSGVAGLYYSRDDGTWQQCGSPDTGRITLPGGVQTLRFYAVDRAGNREAVQSVTYNVDDQPPATAATLAGTPGSGGWYTSDVQVTLAASDDASGAAGTYYLLDGVEYTYGSPFTLGTGSYWLTYWSRDGAGNVESPHDLNICVDTAPPATTATPPGNTGRYTGNVVTLTAAGTSGIRGLYYSIDGNGWRTCSFTDPGVGYVILPEGTHTLSYRAEGNNGLTETARSATYNVDTHKPAITATLAGRQGDNGWYGGSVLVTLAASDNESGVAGISYVLDGSPQNYSDPFTIGDGTHSLTFRATDNAGNVNASGLDNIRVDGTPPTIYCILSGTTNGQGRYLSDVQVTLQTSDDSSGVSQAWYGTDGTSWTGYTGPFTVTKGDQATVRYRCTDNAGNTAEGSRIVSFGTADGNGQGNDGTGYGSMPTPTPAAASSSTPAPSPKSSAKPTATVTPTPTPTPAPTVARMQESTGLSCLLLPLALLLLAIIVAIYVAVSRRKKGRNKRL